MHRSDTTEADRTDPEHGYQPDCGHWYHMMAGQHRATGRHMWNHQHTFTAGR